MKFSKENSFFILALILSLCINIGLGRKVQKLRAQINTYVAVANGESLLGAQIGHLSLKSIDGQERDLNLDDNQKTLIYIFRPNCGWCAKNLENIKAISKFARETSAFKIIGISLDDHGLNEYIRNAGIDFPVYYGISPADTKRLGLGITPQTLYTLNGTIIHNWRGAYIGSLSNEIEHTLRISLPSN